MLLRAPTSIFQRSRFGPIKISPVLGFISLTIFSSEVLKGLARIPLVLVSIWELQKTHSLLSAGIRTLQLGHLISGEGFGVSSLSPDN